MQNQLKNQTSPYLLQHAENPVNWYPWCNEAFERAKREDKPIFLSIGYSTCHWCHVMAHESFEDERIAEILNEYFIAIKVDKEERPDIDHIYMSVCQAFTGSGGWPTTIFLTPEQKPFYAGTYFPKTAKFGQIGLEELLLAIHKKWKTDRKELLDSAEEVVRFLANSTKAKKVVNGSRCNENETAQLGKWAVEIYKRMYDKTYGGFEGAPKFPTPHNLLFLMQYYEKYHEEETLKMAEKTLLQMYRGGMFDHIGGGFSRYSTDPYFLVPHFEKMLYDNALLILTYCKSYQLTGKQIYCDIAEKTAAYILREMTAPEGGFYCAQDADSEGVEGKYYLFEPSEIRDILGEDAGTEFNLHFDITEKGNFEGKNIPNLLKNGYQEKDFGPMLEKVYEYRKKRYTLHLDDKILTSWNGMMIAAMCSLYRVTGSEKYLEAAVKAEKFIRENLYEDGILYVSWREDKRSEKGFLDDYAYQIFALLALYEATLDHKYLEKAQIFCEKTILDFYDSERGGFFLYGKENEQLILRPKETYDGAVPSGNAIMAYNLVRLLLLTGDKKYGELTNNHLDFMSTEAKQYPVGHAMFLLSLSDFLDLPIQITIVLLDETERSSLPCRIPLNAVIKILEKPTKEYPLHNHKTTFYVCRGRSCQPPTNELDLGVRK